MSAPDAAHLFERRTQILVAVADFQTEVVETGVASLQRTRCVLADLDQQKLVVRAAAAEHRGGESERDFDFDTGAGDLTPTEHVAIEGR